MTDESGLALPYPRKKKERDAARREAVAPAANAGRRFPPRLILGDCLEEMAKLPDESVHFIITDPPYGHGNNDGDLIANLERAIPRRRLREDNAARRLRGKETVYEGRPIANDKGEAIDLLIRCLPEYERLLVPGGSVAICCGGGGSVKSLSFAEWSLAMNEVLDFKQAVVWDKGPMGIGWHYRRSYEFVLVATKPGAACRWFDTSDKAENVIRGIPKIIPGSRDHPTPKPVALGDWFVMKHAAPGDVVLDPFMGSAPFGEAAYTRGTQYIGIESDPRWHAMAEARLARLTQLRVRD